MLQVSPSVSGTETGERSVALTEGICIVRKVLLAPCQASERQNKPRPQVQMNPRGPFRRGREACRQRLCEPCEWLDIP